MGLVGTLGRLAVGALVAKGACKLIQNKLGGATGNRGGATRINQGDGGMGGLLGGNSQDSGQGGSQGGGLADLLGGVLGGQQGGGAAGGLGGLLESLSQGGSQGGSQGESQGGGSAAGQGSGDSGFGAPSGGSLGDLLNSVIAGQKPADTTAPQEQETQAAIMLRAMINAAKSDGRLDDGEKQKITSQLGDLSQEDVAFVQKELAAPLDLPGFIKSIPRGMEQQAYLMSLMAIDLDSKAEAEYLDQLAKGTGISESVSNQIHQKLGAPTLYS